MDATIREDRVWDELAFVAGESAQAVARLMAFLCGQGGAWNAVWTGGVRCDGNRDDDPLQGWSVAAVQARHAVAPHS
jgi:hypothetical protein